MDPSLHPIPVVLVMAGLDPTGGAGLQADIETIASMGCHAAPLMTVNTVQDTRGVSLWQPTDAGFLMDQARAVLADLPVAACKIGLTADVAVIQAIHDLLVDHPHLPVVLDPVLASGRGDPLTDTAVRNALRTRLLPLATVVTPNSLEARALAPGTEGLKDAAQQLLESGPEFVLITGAHEASDKVENTLYGRGRPAETFHWERLPHSYHGSGCTLASAIAGLLAQGREPVQAVHEAQEYTWQALRHGYCPGRGQFMPNRLFWARNAEDAG